MNQLSSLYNEIQEKYPNKEIKIIPKESEQKYNNLGFKTVSSYIDYCLGRPFEKCFMIIKKEC